MNLNNWRYIPQSWVRKPVLEKWQISTSRHCKKKIYIGIQRDKNSQDTLKAPHSLDVRTSYTARLSTEGEKNCNMGMRVGKWSNKEDKSRKRSMN